MYTSKRYFLEHEDYMDDDKTVKDLFETILNDPEREKIDEIIIGCWGEAWEESPQEIIDGIVENKDKFAHIKSLYFGDMDFEECEVSWIIQGNYEKLWQALPNLEKVIIKGTTDLELGDMKSDSLKEFQIICGGLPKDCMEKIKEAKFPSLEKLLLYIGVEDYGFDGNLEDIKNMIEQSDFKNLTYLGITDSEIQDDVTEYIFTSKYMNQLTTLDLSNGTLTDKGGKVILENLSKYPNIKELNLEYHFLSEDMMDKLSEIPDVDINLDDVQEADEYDGEVYYYPMLTE